VGKNTRVSTIIGVGGIESFGPRVLMLTEMMADINKTFMIKLSILGCMMNLLSVLELPIGFGPGSKGLDFLPFGIAEVAGTRLSKHVFFLDAVL
jgi:hypothetical protein